MSFLNTRSRVMSAVMMASLVWLPVQANDDSASMKFQEKLWNDYGVRLEKISEPAAKRLHANLNGGMKVTSIRRDSKAAQHRVQAGDVLYGIHMWETLNAENIRFIIEHPECRKLDSLAWHVHRDGQFFPIGMPTK